MNSSCQVGGSGERRGHCLTDHTDLCCLRVAGAERLTLNHNDLLGSYSHLLGELAVSSHLTHSLSVQTPSTPHQQRCPPALLRETFPDHSISE